MWRFVVAVCTGHTTHKAAKMPLLKSPWLPPKPNESVTLPSSVTSITVGAQTVQELNPPFFTLPSWAFAPLVLILTIPVSSYLCLHTNICVFVSQPHEYSSVCLISLAKDTRVTKPSPAKSYVALKACLRAKTRASSFIEVVLRFVGTANSC